MPCQSKSVTDPFRLKEQSIDEIVVGVISHFQSLSAVEQEWYVDTIELTLLLEVLELWDEIMERMSFGLFADKVKSYTNVSQFCPKMQHKLSATYQQSTPASSY